jgi:hypothetical protein
MVTPSDVTRIVVGLASRITERLAARNSQRKLGRHSGGSGRFNTAPLQVWMHTKSWGVEQRYRLGSPVLVGGLVFVQAV